MRNTKQFINLLLIVACFLPAATVLAQSNYSLDIPSFKSLYGTLPSSNLSKDIAQKLSSWEKSTPELADYAIKITYQEGLIAKQYTKKKSKEGFNVYKLTVVSPEFEAVVKGKGGDNLLRKKYGGTKEIIFFGEDLKTKNAGKISQVWWKEKEIFYKEEELKQKYYDDFLNDLSRILQENNNDTATAKIKKQKPGLTSINANEKKEKLSKTTKPSNEITQKTNPPNKTTTKKPTQISADPIAISPTGTKENDTTSRSPKGDEETNTKTKTQKIETENSSAVAKVDKEKPKPKKNPAVKNNTNIDHIVNKIRSYETGDGS